VASFWSRDASQSAATLPRSFAFPLLISLGLALSAVAVADTPPQVILATAGSTQSGSAAINRFTLRFSADMIALGDPRATDPASNDCKSPAKGRWIDTRTWVLEFDKPLPAGKSCHVELKPRLRTASGLTITGQDNFLIDTGGPSARAIMTGDGYEGIEEDQIFLVATNVAADRSSVARFGYCAVDGIGEKIPLDILPADRTREILDGLGQNSYAVQSFAYNAGFPLPTSQSKAEREQSLEQIIPLKCRRPLPPGREMALVWDARITQQGAPNRTAGRDQRFDFRIRPAFTAKMACSRVNPQAGCNPLKDVALRFSSPIPRDIALASRLVTGESQEIAPRPSDDEKNASHLTRINFRGPLPQNVEASITLDAAIKDQSGRPLANASNFPMRFRIDRAPPLVKFAADFGILEASEGGVLPVTVRGVEPALVQKRLSMPTQTMRVDEDDAAILGWLKRVEEAGRNDIRSETNRKGEDVLVNHTGAASIFAKNSASSKKLNLTPPEGGREFEVIGIPLTDKGFHVVEVASPELGAALLGRKATRYVAAAALVTDMAVHFKWGREQSLAWVTSLRNGQPISGADVRIIDSCTGRLLSNGKTDKWGRLVVASGLPAPSTYAACDEKAPTDSTEGHGLMISARQNGDFSFTLSEWGDGIRPYDFDLPYGWSDRPQILHTILDRSLVKAGETVYMKHVRRLPAGSGFTIPAPLSGTLKLRHRGSSTEFELPFRIDQSGSGETAWAVPKSAPMGDYDLIYVTQKMVKGKSEEETIWSQQSVRVDEYRLPTMKAVISGPKHHLVRPAQVPLSLFLGYLSGGPAANTPVDLRTQFTPSWTAPRDYRDWDFDGENIQEGLIRLDDNGEAPQAEMPLARSASLALGTEGTAQTQIAVDQAVTRPTLMSVEMDYPDANGQTLTSTRRITLYPSAIRLGVKTDGWMMRADDLRLRFVALDLDAQPVPGQRVDVQLFNREILTARRRLIGGFYAYDNQLKTTRLNATCSARTDKLGRAACAIAPNVSGEVIVVATTRDADGNESRAVRSIWLAGKDDWWFGGDNGDRMDVIPEKTSYKAGETAKFQVRMPFREATALVTVEREGVLSSNVVTLKGDNPVVEVKLPAHYAPDVYVSVLAVRGRVTGHESWFRKMKRAAGFQIENSEGAAPTARVDLGKPAYRLGISRIRVGWEGHQLSVDVKADKPSYSVRETAKVTVQVKRPDGKAAANANVAFAAVDEALLQLSPNPSWDILSAMMGERPLNVLTSTAQMQVVGKRHYGRKALEPGGGGGGDLSGLTRDNFRPILLWKGNVALDAQGKASIDVPLSDNLSAFRMVAIASDGAQLFGSGETTVRTVQDLAIISAMPELVRTGDQFDARFTLRNSTAKPMQVTAQAEIMPAYATMPPLTVTIPAGGTVPISWAIEAPANEGTVEWRVTARSADAKQTDTLALSQEIAAATPMEAWAQTLLQVGTAQSLPVTAPAGAIGQSYVDVALASTVAPPLAGVRAYMAKYPYDSLEHKVSRAIVLDDIAHWQSIMDMLPTYMDQNGLLRYWPRDTSSGSAELTAYVLSISAAHGFALPDGMKDRAINALQAMAEGRLTQRGYGSYDVRAIRIAALAALARNQAATANMVSTINVAPTEMSTATLSDWLTIINKTPAIQGAAQLRRAAETELRRRMVYEGTRLDLIDDANAPWWMMVSSDEMAIKALDAVLGQPSWKADDGRLMTGIAQRQQRGRWNSTPANAWGAIVVRRFAQLYPAQAITGVSTATLRSNSASQSWPLPQNAAALRLALTTGPLRLDHQGGGSPWATVTVQAAVPLTAPLQAGYTISRTITPITQKTNGHWTRGDVIRVKISFKATAGRTWVAIRDPLPPGASVIGSLGGQSVQLTQGGDTSGARPDYVEARLDNWQAHYAWLPAGEHSVEYVVRLNSSGTFSLPETRIEALYSPSIRGAWPNGQFRVGSH
jgi:uncharacterized protein YfaS (alpha-2-macroglobulin family)